MGICTSKQSTAVSSVGGGIGLAPFHQHKYTNDIQFHDDVHGVYISIGNSGRTATRTESFNNGVCLSHRPLQDNELFEIRIDETSDTWQGSLAIGVTSYAPDEFDVPEALSDISYNCWYINGREIVGDGDTVAEFPVDLDSLPAGSSIGVMRTTEGELHFYLGGEDKGSACDNLPEDVYALVDIYGLCVGVSITPNSTVKSGPIIRHDRLPMIQESDDNEDSDDEREEVAQEGKNDSDEDDEEPTGLRVIRGPDWKWGDQDGGPGGVGTALLDSCEDACLTVKWDSGLQNMYRVGAEGGKHDLRILDVAQAGICHVYNTAIGQMTINCDECGENPIKGIRWKCAVCDDYDLCTSCYMSDKHDVNHQFERHVTLNDDDPDIVPPRFGCQKIKTFGIFEGAVVTKGPDWEWGDQDNGEHGVVLAIRDWDENTYNSGAQVIWGGFRMELYRVGAGGKMDLRYVRPADKFSVYHEHLPLFSMENEDEEADPNVVLLKGLAAAMETLASERPKTAVQSHPERARSTTLFDTASQNPSPSAGECQKMVAAKSLLEKLCIHHVFFNPNYDLCFCDRCAHKRNEKPVYERGKPPVKYALPLGWCRIGLKLPNRAAALGIMEEWHVAYHGTAVQNIKKILEHDDLLMPGEVGMEGSAVKEGEGHYNDDWKPDDFNTKQVFLSPSVKYAGLAAYARPFKFTDTKTKKEHQCRVAFQVRIKQDSYVIKPETVLDADQKHRPIDIHIDNSELEWSTTQKRVIVLTGLLVKIDN